MTTAEHATDTPSAEQSADRGETRETRETPKIAPWLPPGQLIDLPDRGTTFARMAPGPSTDSPTLLLLHGWTATADLNWYMSYAPLAKHFNLLALDHRGHGQGPPPATP